MCTFPPALLSARVWQYASIASEHDEQQLSTNIKANKYSAVIPYDE